MKKTLKNIVLVLVLLIGVFTLSGCDKKESKKEETSKIVGKWAHGDFIYTFNKDNTGVYDAAGTKMEFTYEDNGKEISFLYTGNTEPLVLKYKIDGKKLIIKDSFDNDVEYTKK